MKKIISCIILAILVLTSVCYYQQSKRIHILIPQSYFENSGILIDDFLEHNQFVSDEKSSPNIEINKDNKLEIIYKNETDYYKELYYSALGTAAFFMQFETNSIIYSIRYQEDLSYLSVFIDDDLENQDFEANANIIYQNAFKQYILTSTQDMTISFINKDTKEVIYQKIYYYEG